MTPEEFDQQCKAVEALAIRQIKAAKLLLIVSVFGFAFVVAGLIGIHWVERNVPPETPISETPAKIKEALKR